MARSNVVVLKAQPREPEIVSHNTTPTVLDYLREVQSLGAVEGAMGDQALSAELVPLLEAIHHVLAGGSAEVKVTSPGNAKIVAGLEEKVGRMFDEANRANCSIETNPVPFYL